MINLSIPGTGSSGHIAGGLLLAILLGPHAAFLTMASILTIQALFFADGGLLALGCNLFNMGFFPCFVAFPFIYQRIAAARGRKRVLAASLVASIVSLQLGSLAVVTETVLSGVSDLTFWTFLLLMQSIHLAIGIVEGLVTASLVSFVYSTRPEILEAAKGSDDKSISIRPVLITLIIIAALTGGMLSWFASANPDGLERSTALSSGNDSFQSPDSRIHALFSMVQKKIAFLPDYNFRKDHTEESAKSEKTEVKEDAWPSASAGTSVSGLLGGAMSLVLAGLIGLG